MRTLTAGQFGVALVALSSFLAGCVSIPSHKLSAMPSSASYSMKKSVANSLLSPVFQSGGWPADDWWKDFGDPELDALVAKALADSPDLKVAQARLDLAQQTVAGVRSALFPEVSANASAIREKFSENGLFPPPIAGSTHTQGQMTLDLAYHLDLWGQDRAIVRAQLGRAKVAEAEAAQTRLAVASAVAQVYFQLQGDEARLAVADESLVQQKTFRHLVGLRVASGLETQLALKLAETDVAADEANIELLRNSVAHDKYGLAALIGAGPDAAETFSAPAGHFNQPFPLPASLPIDFVARRPDVIAKRWQVESAAEEIGAARAGFYPNISLTAQFGKQSLDLNRLLDSGSNFGLFGPAIHLPIFEGGLLRANLKARYAQYDLAVSQYRKSIIDAAREVADRLASLASVTRELARQTEAREASESAYDLAVMRYKAGISDYLTVLIVQRDLLAQRTIEAGLRARRLQAVTQLIYALGGGYGRDTARPAHP